MAQVVVTAGVLGGACSLLAWPLPPPLHTQAERGQEARPPAKPQHTCC